jgi:hypothetical protein
MMGMPNSSTRIVRYSSSLSAKGRSDQEARQTEEINHATDFGEFSRNQDTPGLPVALHS